VGNSTGRELSQSGLALRPTPSGALEVSVRCWTSRARGAPFTRHRVLVGRDWSVGVPHDLAAERLASALGGWLSCLELEDRAVPAARRWLEFALRAVVPPIVPLGQLGWTSASPLRCCPVRGFESAEGAFEHVRDVRHLSELYQADRKQVGDLVRPMRTAWRAAQALTIPGEQAAWAAELVGGGARDVAALWYAGVHPDRIVAIHATLGVRGRLPARLYLGIVLRNADPAWVGSTMRAAGVEGATAEVARVAGVPLDGPAEESVAEWLAWTESDWDVADRSARGRWLALGVSRVSVMQLAQAGYDPVEVARLAAGTGRSADGAARHLTAWLAGALKPRVEDLVALHRSGRWSSWSVPSRAAVERVREALPDSGRRADRLDLAYLLAVCSTVPDAVAAHRAGRTWRDELGADYPTRPISRSGPIEEQESA
jgi:hypothetical protein